MPNLEHIFVQALSSLCESITLGYRYERPNRVSDEDLLHILIIVLELPVLGSSECLEVALPKVSFVARKLLFILTLANRIFSRVRWYLPTGSVHSWVNLG